MIIKRQRVVYSHTEAHHCSHAGNSDASDCDVIDLAFQPVKLALVPIALELSGLRQSLLASSLQLTD